MNPPILFGSEEAATIRAKDRVREKLFSKENLESNLELIECLLERLGDDRQAAMILQAEIETAESEIETVLSELHTVHGYLEKAGELEDADGPKLSIQYVRLITRVEREL